MPIYRYECAACGAEQEVWAKVDEPAPEACSECGEKGTLAKMVARTAFHLKGGGWYAHGYGSKGANKAATPSPKADTASSDTGGSSKSDSSSSASSDD